MKTNAPAASVPTVFLAQIVTTTAVLWSVPWRHSSPQRNSLGCCSVEKGRLGLKDIYPHWPKLGQQEGCMQLLWAPGDQRTADVQLAPAYCMHWATVTGCAILPREQSGEVLVFLEKCIRYSST